jgi:hypothetical protein
MAFSNQNITEFFEQSPIQASIFVIIILLFLAILYFIEDMPFMQDIGENLFEYRQKLMVSLVVKDNEIQNTNSWSLRNIAIYILNSYDMV